MIAFREPAIMCSIITLTMWLYFFLSDSVKIKTPKIYISYETPRHLDQAWMAQGARRTCRCCGMDDVSLFYGLHYKATPMCKYCLELDYLNRHLGLQPLLPGLEKKRIVPQVTGGDTNAKGFSTFSADEFRKYTQSRTEIAETINRLNQMAEDNRK